MTRKIRFPRKLFNEKFYPYVFDIWDKPVTLNLGSAGSSKSVHAAMKNVIRLMFKKQNVLAVRETYASMKDSVFSQMKQSIAQMGVESLFSCTVSPLCIKCIPTKRMMIFRGLDKVDKIKSIVPEVGIINHVDWEEATESEENDLNQLQFRSRGGGNKRSVQRVTETMNKILTAKNETQLVDIRREILSALDLTESNYVRESKTLELRFNTVSADHWIAKRFVFSGKNGKAVFDLPVFTGHETWQERYDRSIYDTPELFIIHSTHWDNQFLTEEDNLKYESYRFIDQYYYDVYARGLWGVLGDTIFTRFKLARFTDEFVQTIPKIMVGMDYGDADPTVMVRVGIDQGKRAIYILDEVGGAKLGNDNIISMAKGFLWYDKEPIYCDPAGGITVTTMQDSGFQMLKASKPKGYKEQFIMAMKSYTIYISEDCPQFLNEIRNYCYNKDKNGNAIDKAPDGNDHMIDAGLFYGLNSIFIGMCKTKIYG